METCIICDAEKQDTLSVASEASLHQIQTFSQKWADIGKHKATFMRVKDLTYSDQAEHKYHRKCYQSLCHQTHLSKAQQSHEKAVQQAAAHKRRSDSVEESSSAKSRKPFDQDLCVFCQTNIKAEVHEVTTHAMGARFLNIKSMSKNVDIRARLAFLHDPRDAFAQNMKYHTNCLRKETRNVQLKENAKTGIERDFIAEAICDIEIVNIVQELVADENHLPNIDMNSIQDTYLLLLRKHKIICEPGKNYKPYLKTLLEEHIPGLQFVKRGPKPMIIVSDKTKDQVFRHFHDEQQVTKEMDIVYKASQIIRKEIETLEDWHFTGSFDDYQSPRKLQQMMKWIISGPHTNLMVKRETEIEQSSRNLAQHVHSSFRTTRQLKYESKLLQKFQKDKVTPLTVGLALTSYQANRSRSEIETLNNVQLAIPYDEVERTTTRMASAVMEDIEDKSESIHIPSFVKKGIRPLYAIDNIDWGSDAGSLHGADLMVAQKNDEEGRPVLSKDLKLDKNMKSRTLPKLLPMTYQDCPKPRKPTVKHTRSYTLDQLKDSFTCNKETTDLWLLMGGRVVDQALWKSDEDDSTEISESLGNDRSELENTSKQPLSKEVPLENRPAEEKIRAHTADDHEGASPRSSDLNDNTEKDLASIGIKDKVQDNPSVFENLLASKTTRKEDQGNRHEAKTSDHATTSVLTENAGSESVDVTNVQKYPSWATFNSMIGETVPIWSVGIAAPLYRRSPTEWPVLLTILMQAQHINCVTVGENYRPIITLDGDLYDRAVKLPAYKSKWCIRLGALHMTMAALKCLGKYIEGSGLDLAWETTGIYGSATVRQILDGRHVYRCLEAHTMTLVAVHTLYQQVFFPKDDIEELYEKLDKTLESFKQYIADGSSRSSSQYKLDIEMLRNTLRTTGILDEMGECNGNERGVKKFLINYMKQVKVLLVFTAAIRDANWKLHLSTTELLLTYFHAHDQYNYGRWGPLYVADMLELQETDPETWAFLDAGNFVISKHGTPFSAIDPDHAIEQEHKKMKMKGGFVGITGNEQAMEKHFIIAPALSEFVQAFKEYAGIESRKPCSLHHELTSHKGAKLVKNATKVARSISLQGNPFLKDDMHNLITFAVTPADISENIENRDDLGKESLEKFVASRMTDNTTEFWDPQKKNKFAYFKDIGAVVQTKIKGQLVHVRQERNLISRLLVIAKSRPDFIVKDAIVEFEFNVTPPSNFHPDGSMIMLSNKASLVDLIMNMPEKYHAISDPNIVKPITRVLIIDAMCVVHMIVKTPEMTTAKHFAENFLQIIGNMGSANRYDELRVVFDQYLQETLKETTRDKRIIKTVPIHYHVNDDTEIKSIKSFLAHVSTKAELTEYLSNKLLWHYRGHKQKVLVMHHTKMESNVPLSDIVSMPAMSGGCHSLEEADQLVVLNALDVAHKDSQSSLDVFSVDTDVFVLLIAHSALLPQSTTLIRKGGERLNIRESHLKLGKQRSDALIGWYAFKGTDNTGSFAGKGVACQFKAFLQADDDILDAFSNFGSSPEIPNWIHRQMERFVCLLYSTGDLCADDIKQLRWQLFAQKNKEGQQLPPTTGTLVPHTTRAYYMALVWRYSRCPCPEIPPPTDFFWERVDGRLRPTYCTRAPAPEAILHLHKCNCKTGCSKKTCGCNKNNLTCTDMCGCGDTCKNTYHERPLEPEEAD